MHTDALFTRGIQFPQPATGEVKLLAEQVAGSFGVTAHWSDGDTRLEVVGPRDAVDTFAAMAGAALSLCTHPSHAIAA